MPLEAPQLDTRTFEELVNEARRRIPRYTPEWTDFNDSDPGMTLVQLFAWFTEMMLYQMNRIPDLNYIKFLQMLNMELRAAQPATAHLTFTPSAGTEVGPVRQYTQVGAQTAAGDVLIFETQTGLSLTRVPLAAVQVWENDFKDVTETNTMLGTTYYPFGWRPQVNSALYLGFLCDPQQPLEGSPFGEQIHLRVFLPEASESEPAQNASEVENPPAPPVKLAWEYKLDDTSERWLPLNVNLDETAAFMREGYILLGGPSVIKPTLQGTVKDACYWLRCRVVSGSYPAGCEPVIDAIRPNVVMARNLATVRQEVIGTSTGHPDQTFELRYNPVQPGSLDLRIEIEGEDPAVWQEVQDFYASKKNDPHFTFNANRGLITFGNGRDHGGIPDAGAQIVAYEYRYGGGDAGNVGPDAINAPLTALTGVDSVTNERKAVGGRDEQSLEDFKRRAPFMLRSRDRAITEEDFTALAREAGGVANATAIALMHPDYPEVKVPGAVTVVIVPDNDDCPPRPSSELIRSVARYLNQHRLLTTELYVKGPEYSLIEVEATLYARPDAAFDAIAQDAQAALNNYLAPLRKTSTGRVPGWKFDEDLYPTNLYAELRKVEGVLVVEYLTLHVDGKLVDNLLKPIRLPPDGLVYGKTHTIHVMPQKDL